MTDSINAKGRGAKGTEKIPVYSKFRQEGPVASGFYSIEVNEGWRSWILCSDMYEWAADDLIARLTEHPKEWQHE